MAHHERNAVRGPYEAGLRRLRNISCSPGVKGESYA
jgi:hypothetical protein